MTNVEKVGYGICAYLFVVVAAAITALLLIFPGVGENQVLSFPCAIGPADRQLAIMALCAGIAGSFIYGAQSLSTYLGNEQFKLSWVMWYVLRPWIGGVLGLAIYFTFKAGFVGGATTVNPYGIVAISLLAGWYSKTTSDKLQEVFETMFKTDADKKRGDKLTAKPVIITLTPSPLPAGQNQLTITGTGFQSGATILFNNQAHPILPHFVSDKQLDITFAAANRPAPGNYHVQVKNPSGGSDTSDAVTLTIQ